MADAATQLNALSVDQARGALFACCGAERWVEEVLARRPYPSEAELQRYAEHCWAALSDTEVLAAFSHHPRIGENLDLLRARFTALPAADFSRQEQAGVSEASESTLLALRDGNRAYEARFGFIFLVFASGKSAAEMLALLTERMQNDAATELAIARGEHAKITRLRLTRLTP